ncbi:MAG: hypothetical protein Q9220_001834 [cf. Caloplaca sp. 1 TL-2023]
MERLRIRIDQTLITQFDGNENRVQEDMSDYSPHRDLLIAAKRRYTRFNNDVKPQWKIKHHDSLGHWKTALSTLLISLNDIRQADDVARGVLKRHNAWYTLDLIINSSRPSDDTASKKTAETWYRREYVDDKIPLLLQMFHDWLTDEDLEADSPLIIEQIVEAGASNA